MKRIDWATLTTHDRRRILTRPAEQASTQICQAVLSIKQQLIQEGDEALYRFAKEFDKVVLTDLKVSDSDCQHAIKHVSCDLKSAIDIAYRNIEAFHTAQIPTLISTENTQGVRCELMTRPIEKVGLYIPGGTAPLFSTVLMLALPAKIAGCGKVVLCSPAPIAPEIVYTAKLCGIQEIYAIGGAGAIFAMAYGTTSIPKVDKIFGPGNAFVTEAKRQVMMTGTAIDMPAGPSEVLVIADDTANSAFVASDLLSQAEHGSDSQVMLVTPSTTFADKVMADIKKQLALLPRAKISTQSLKHSFVIIADDLPQCVEISNAYAPEHLIIQTSNPRALLADIKHAGSVFLGHYSPESMGDYASGTNHVLPTYGYARTVSSLSLADFSKRMTVQELTADGFLQLANSVEMMAKAERLDAHALAVQVRVKALTNEQTHDQTMKDK